MAFKFPDKDPNEKLDYTVDWSRYLERDTISVSQINWKIQKEDGSVIDLLPNRGFQNDVLVVNETASATLSGAVSSSTTLVVTSVSGTIRVGHKVTGTGITSSVYVTAVVGTSITVSSSVSIEDATALSFTVVGLVRASDNTSTYFTTTTMTAVLDKGETNKNYTLLAEITTTNSPRTTAAITTSRKINLKVRERV